MLFGVSQSNIFPCPQYSWFLTLKSACVRREGMIYSKLLIFCGWRESYLHFCGRKLLSFSWHFSSIVVLLMTYSLSSSLFKQYSCFLWLTTFNTYSCSFSLVFYTSNKNARLAHAERQSVLSVWITVLPLNWSGKYLHFIKYICCWVLLLWIPCPLQGLPGKGGLISEMWGGVVAAGLGGERKRRTKRDTTRLVGSRAECKGRVCPPVPCEHWFLLAEPVWDAASGVCPRGSAHHPSEASITQLQHSALISPFSCSPSVLWGKFLRDASSYSFNPLSSLNSIKLGLMKASSDLLIKNCFHRTDFCLQPVFSSCVDTWNFWLRILTTVVSGNGSCPSPQKCWLSSSKF